MGIIILVLTYKRFRFSNFLYVLILVHCCVLFVGGKYTYAENPLFDYLKGVFDWQRNNYDKVGHFAQGFIPALLSRELLLRLKVVTNKRWMFFLALTIVMFISAIYELIEWGTSILLGQSADQFLGTQGYVWDTQSDMLFALIGSLGALILFSSLQDRMIQAMEENRNP